MDAISRTVGSSNRPQFDAAVDADGYRWWYVDGLSPDGRSGIVVIGFIGSVFSPYYFRARAKGEGQPENYCAMNVGLYRPRSKLWAMTERGADSLSRDFDWISIGASSMTWQDDRLEIELRERAMPFAQSIVGKITVRPECLNSEVFSLHTSGRHEWQPIAPLGHIDVALRKPHWRWSGEAYLDTNGGSWPLEEDFRDWTWSRSNRGENANIVYVTTQTNAVERFLSVRVDRDGVVHDRPLPPRIALPATGWKVQRHTYSGSVPAIERTLEDTPFYARSVLRTQSSDAPIWSVHESLSLSRFRTRWVRGLLPFRMPRVSGSG